ncbi:MAG: hypothetical protein M3O46_01855, partial [Myxococcota bacterium]|nr:hypothetical protein [Myxococcota bacterium]
ESAAAARRAIDVEPYSPNLWAALAAAELEAGNTARARQDAEKALSILVEYPLALEIRSQAAEKLGDQTDAAADRIRLIHLARESTDDDTRRAATALLRPAE